jgi:hypothetical protein
MELLKQRQHQCSRKKRKSERKRAGGEEHADHGAVEAGNIAAEK